MEWSNFKKRIFIKNKIDKIYSAWATQEMMEIWFLEEAKYFDSTKNPRKPNELVKGGDSFIWKWNNWDFKEEGKILSANGIDKISFTFGAGGNVHIKLTPYSNGVEVELVQDNIPTDEKNKMDIYVGCITGWTFWLTNLKAYLEHGITLHAKNLKQEETKDLVNS